MTTIFNTDPARIDLEATQGDSIYMEFYVNLGISPTVAQKFYTTVNIAPTEGVPFYIYEVIMQVRRKDGLLLKDWTSVGSPADILLDMVDGGYMGLFDPDGFLESGEFDYDVKVYTDAILTQLITIMRGSFTVKKQITK
jgi:hypothetical protein